MIQMQLPFTDSPAFDKTELAEELSVTPESQDDQSRICKLVTGRDRPFDNNHVIPFEALKEGDLFILEDFDGFIEDGNAVCRAESDAYFSDENKVWSINACEVLVRRPCGDSFTYYRIVPQEYPGLTDLE